MYHEKTDTYSCDICGFEMDWEDHDDEHGDLWSCAEPPSARNAP